MVRGPDGFRIEAVDMETGEIKALSPGRHPRYTPTGHLLFVDDDATLLAAPFDVEGLELTGDAVPVAESLSVLANGTGFFAVSETGTLVYRTGASGGGIVTPVWVERDGSEEALIPRLFSGVFEAPRVSPDGRKIAVQNTPEGSTQSQIWIYDLDQETFSPLTFEGSNITPFWSPDGVEVGFISDRDGGRAVYSRAWDRSGEVRLLHAGSDVTIIEPRWTPNAEWLVYEVHEGSPTIGHLFYAAPHPDSAAVIISDTPFHEGWPSVSPDGRWLVYASDESGQFEVYVRPFRGPGGVSPVSLDGGSAPVWAHNGREIVYSTVGNFSPVNLPATNWVVATVRTNPDFTVESRTPFATTAEYLGSGSTRNFDISPDDQRLLVLRIEGGVEDELILVENWAEELRQRVGSN